MSRNPHNNQEWQDAVNAAHALLALDSARKYGLVEGGPKVNVKRAQELLKHGKALGILPAPDAIQQLVRELNS